MLSSSSPVLYWYAAVSPKRAIKFLYFSLSYATLGVCFFSFGMPWT
jgi:hypothetical protein